MLKQQKGDVKSPSLDANKNKPLANSSTFVGMAITHDETISLDDYDEKMSIYKPIVENMIDRINAIDDDTVSLGEAIGGYTFSSEDALSGYALGGEPSFPLTVSTGDNETDAVVAYAIGDTTYEIQDSVMVGHFDANGKDTVRRIYLTKVDKGLEDIIAKFEWAGYALNVKENYIEFVNPPVDQFKEFIIDILGQGYVDREKGTSSIQADVAFGTRRDRLLSYETWLESDKGKENRELFRFVWEAHERRKGSLNSSGKLLSRIQRHQVARLWRVLVPSLSSQRSGQYLARQYRLLNLLTLARKLGYPIASRKWKMRTAQNLTQRDTNGDSMKSSQKCGFDTFFTNLYTTKNKKPR
ncbi:MAG: hypothetical protein PUC66_00170 [Erysipelotrichaceae bacterium]|nr:hypothetical protein [Erysipelotrichaceae bacterium]